MIRPSPIGVWDEVREDGKGLWVKGRLLPAIAKGREAADLIAAGAIDGLSIGYRTVKAAKNDKGQRLLTELELWEVSLVTFPMLPSARVAAKAERCLEEDTCCAIWRRPFGARARAWRSADAHAVHHQQQDMRMSKTEIKARAGEGLSPAQAVAEADAGFRS